MGSGWVKVAIFSIVSLVLWWFSREPLKDPFKHGYFRFFAFESILGLILLNYRQWFVDPLTIRQLVSWVVLGISIYLAVSGFYILKKVGKPEGAIENTTVLVTKGVYQFIRHPLYTSLAAFGWGAALKDPRLAAMVLAIVNTVFLYAAAQVEEGENLKRFGEEYRRYRETTKMFIPYVF